MIKVFTAILVVATVSIAAAQGPTNPVETAKSLVVNRMESAWQSPVKVVWGEARTSTNGDEVVVFGYGLAHRESTNLDAVITFEVKTYTIRRLAPRVDYDVLRWSDTPINDGYLFAAAKKVVEQRIRVEMRSSPRLDFAEPKFTNISTEARLVEGSGTFALGGLTGAFMYSVTCSRTTGVILSVAVSGAPSNPGAGWGGYNSFTEGIAQSHAAEYVRKREGYQVQVQFTGQVTHTLVSKGVDRVAGRGQWRRGNNFAWNDFRYDVQVGVDDGKIIGAVVSLTPDSHGNPEDQKFIGFAQAAVRREFAFRSSAQVSFLSATAKAIAFGKKSISGDFSAGGKRYHYEVIMDTATTRTERVSISGRE